MAFLTIGRGLGTFKEVQEVPQVGGRCITRLRNLSPPPLCLVLSSLIPAAFSQTR